MAMLRTTVKVEGLKDLLSALEELPRSTSRAVLRKALTAAGKPIEDAAEARAPVDKGHLRQTISTNTRLTKRQKAVHRRYVGQLPAERTAQGFRSKPSTAVYVFVGPAGLAQSIPQEFGTADHAAQPFMRPAWDGQGRNALAIVTQQISVEIQNAVARIARKAAREAAKLTKA